VIYNGIDLNRFQLNRSELIKEIGGGFDFGSDDIVIGSVARFDPVKNMGALVKAFSKIEKTTLGPVKLLLVGDGPELPGIQKMAVDLGLRDRVVFTGMRRDIPDCLGMMDIYVQPSRFEGIPNSVLEAMASGLPVVATNVGGVHEIVEDGKTGFLVDLDNEAGLIRAIEFLIRHADRRRQMGADGKKRAMSRFSISKMVSDYENLYERLTKSDH
jgi:glycosyltransferase involved in cell wall biosynthesis